MLKSGELSCTAASKLDVIALVAGTSAAFCRHRTSVLLLLLRFGVPNNLELHELRTPEDCEQCEQLHRQQMKVEECEAVSNIVLAITQASELQCFYTDSGAHSSKVSPADRRRPDPHLVNVPAIFKGGKRMPTWAIRQNAHLGRPPADDVPLDEWQPLEEAPETAAVSTEPAGSKILQNDDAIHDDSDAFSDEDQCGIDASKASWLLECPPAPIHDDENENPSRDWSQTPKRSWDTLARTDLVKQEALGSTPTLPLPSSSFQFLQASEQKDPVPAGVIPPTANVQRDRQQEKRADFDVWEGPQDALPSHQRAPFIVEIAAPNMSSEQRMNSLDLTKSTAALGDILLMGAKGSHESEAPKPPVLENHQVGKQSGGCDAPVSFPTSPLAKSPLIAPSPFAPAHVPSREEVLRSLVPPPFAEKMSRREHYSQQLRAFYNSLQRRDSVFPGSQRQNMIGSFNGHHATFPPVQSARGNGDEEVQCYKTQQIAKIPQILNIFEGCEEDLFKMLRAKFSCPQYPFVHH